MKVKKQYPGIDLFKFVGAIMIIMLHANPIGDGTLPGIVLRQIITPVAVPFFFAASGFLWYRPQKSGGGYTLSVSLRNTWSGA